MKIGIFSDSWVPNLNGVVISIINEIQSLKDQYEFVVFVPKLKQSKPFRIEGVPIYELRSFPFPAYPGYNIALPCMTLSHALRKEKLDFIHSHSPFSLGLAAVLTARTFFDLPLLNTYHTDIVEYSGHLLRGFQAERLTTSLEKYIWIINRWFYKFSDVVITPSKTLQQKLKSNGLKPPVYSLPNMISEVFFQKQKESEVKDFQENLRINYRIKDDHRLIIYCGRISFEKKLEVMLKSYSKIEKTHPDTFLLIVGDGPHLKMYEKQARKLKLKNYAFTGFISHTKLPWIYRMGEFMVTPSDTETQGLTVLEAMSQNLPVIGVAGGGVLDYIKNEENGLLTPPGDVKAFTEAMTDLLDNQDKISEFGQKAYKTAQNFSKSGYIKLLKKVFDVTINLHNS